MARVTLLLHEARVAGLDVRRDAETLVIRGPLALDRLARELIALKPMLLALLEDEDWCRGHERYAHHGRHVGWWQRPDGGLVCALCHPPIQDAATDTAEEASER